MWYLSLSLNWYERPSIFFEIDTWGRFRLIGWQNKVDPRQERDLYKVPHWRRATTTRELSGSIKSLAISHRYDRAVLLCHVRRHRYKLPSLSYIYIYIYQSRQRGDVNISRSIINKTWNPKHIRHSSPFYTARSFFFYISSIPRRCAITPLDVLPLQRHNEREIVSATVRFANWWNFIFPFAAYAIPCPRFRARSRFRFDSLRE